MKYLHTSTEIERGILTSLYKQEIKMNVNKMRSQTISKIKDRITTNHTLLSCQMGLVLKLSMFTLILLVTVL